MAAGQGEAFDGLWDRYDDRMVRAASVLIRRLKIDEADLDGEGAANLTLFKICRAANRGKLDTIKNSDQFWGYFARILERVVLDASDRQKARKRGGPGHHQDHSQQGNQEPTGAGVPSAGQALRRTDSDLDQLRSPLPAAEDLVLAQQDFEVFVERLADPLSRKILTLKLEHYTNVEICHRLDLSIWTVERKLSAIRRVYLRHRTGGESDQHEERPQGPRSR